MQSILIIVTVGHLLYNSSNDYQVDSIIHVCVPQAVFVFKHKTRSLNESSNSYIIDSV